MTAIALDDRAGWRQALEAAAARTAQDQDRVRAAATAYAHDYIAREGSARKNMDMFQAVLASARPGAGG